MRLSLRKVVKLTTFLALIVILNVWISYNVNFWSFNNFDERGKVLPTWRRSQEDNGGEEPGQLFDSGGVDIQGRSAVSGLFRNQRSARSFKAVSESAQSPQHQQLVTRSREALVAQETYKVSRGNNLLPKILNSNRKNGTKYLEQAKVRSGVQRGSVKLFRDIEKTTLKDIFISVKTTSKYHGTRVKLLLQTWYLLAREQVYFFTDANDTEIAEVLGDHLINTNCSTDHSRRALSCKMAVEFDYYMASRKRKQALQQCPPCLASVDSDGWVILGGWQNTKGPPIWRATYGWFCHVDDDVYLNVPCLVEMLQGYNHKEDWYLGKPSLKHPLEVTDRETSGMKLTFWFATGGAGFCISRSLALKMAPYAGGGRFMTTAETIRLPDDCTLGYIIEHLLKQKLTVVEEFHSHLEALWLIKSHQLAKQITLSYSEYSGKQNVINIQGFSEQEDPTRFKSLHCFLFPNFPERMPHGEASMMTEICVSVEELDYSPATHSMKEMKRHLSLFRN